MALTAILTTALIFPNIGPVEASEKTKFTRTAMKADTSDKLKPKAFGEKTKDTICNEKPCFDDSEDKKLDIKQQKIKDKKKAAEHKKAVAFMKSHYGI